VPTLSLAGGIDANYEVAAGKTSVVISSASKLNARSVSIGTGQMIFHWVQEGKTQAWRCDISLLEPRLVQPADVSTGGVQKLMVDMGELFPAGLLLQGRMVGTLLAPAIHFDIPWWQDVWVFLIRAPWFPLKLQLAKPVLTVSHGASRATATLSVSGASLSAQVTIEGTDYKGASLTVVRGIGSNTSKELVGEITAGNEAVQWTPIARTFDLLLVVHHSLSEKELAQVASGLGAQESQGFLGPGSMQGDYVLCDGPAIGYSLSLKGHRGLLENDEDVTYAKLSW
jgi:hypothetical protein